MNNLVKAPRKMGVEMFNANTGEKEELHVNITEEEINDIKYKKNNNRKNLIHECDAMVPCLFCLIMERPIYLHSKHNI